MNAFVATLNPEKSERLKQELIDLLGRYDAYIDITEYMDEHCDVLVTGDDVHVDLYSVGEESLNNYLRGTNDG
jgi:hypothetical protein